MRLILFPLTATLLCACAIKSNNPDYTYPAASDASGADWPKLAVTSELESAGQSTSQTAQENQAEAEQLAARARALQARAARLRKQIKG